MQEKRKSFYERMFRIDNIMLFLIMYLITILVTVILSNMFTLERELLILVSIFVCLIVIMLYWLKLILELLNSSQNLEKNRYHDYEKVDKSIAVQTIYLDYKTLQVSDLSKLLASYYNLYKLFYRINYSNYIDNIEVYFKNHPEDILEILSAHTGNSITIKTKTGWTPSVGIKDGDFQLSIPKGYVTLVFIGYLLQKLFSFGITSYKDILEIENLKLNNEKLQYELQELKEKCKQQNIETNEEIQNEILKFYYLTMYNSNIRRIEITPSSDIQK